MFFRLSSMIMVFVATCEARASAESALSLTRLTSYSDYIAVVTITEKQSFKKCSLYSGHLLKGIKGQFLPNTKFIGGRSEMNLGQSYLIFLQNHKVDKSYQGFSNPFYKPNSTCLSRSLPVTSNMWQSSFYAWNARSKPSFDWMVRIGYDKAPTWCVMDQSSSTTLIASSRFHKLAEAEKLIKRSMRPITSFFFETLYRVVRRLGLYLSRGRPHSYLALASRFDDSRNVMPIDPPPPAPDPEIVVDGIRQKIDLGAQQASFLAGLTLDYIRNSLLGGGGGAAGESNNRDGKCNVPQPDGSTPSSNARAVRNAVRTAGSVARTSPLAGAATYGALAGAWLAAVVPYSVSDYKRQPGGTDSMGNVNYGATGSALGIPLNILLRAAGGVQAPNPQNQGHPCDLSPNSSYGDRPRDQDDIKAGAKC